MIYLNYNYVCDPQTGYTALHLAAEAGHSHIIAAIIELVPFLNCAQYVLTGDSKTSLHLAVSSGVQESVVLLLSQQTSTINITDKVIRTIKCEIISIL